ncbi:MAG TPA: hypothetical protein VIJ22_01145 [Polyangiaceae bacterium]
MGDSPYPARSDVSPTWKPGGFVATFDYHGPGNTNATAPGFDGVTGLGSPNGPQFLGALGLLGGL